MRINKFIALHSSYSRRSADELIEAGRVMINGHTALPGQQVAAGDKVLLDDQLIEQDTVRTILMLNKPKGYVTSRRGQGNKSVYELLADKYTNLQAVGRLDKDSTGLLLFTNDGELANKLTHPSYEKIKIYEVEIDKPLQPLHQQMISDHGIEIGDGASKLQIEKLNDSSTKLKIFLKEGRNRQIRRTFEALGYQVQSLHRTTFGDYSLNNLRSGQYTILEG